MLNLRQINILHVLDTTATAAATKKEKKKKNKKKRRKKKKTKEEEKLTKRQNLIFSSFPPRMFKSAVSIVNDTDTNGSHIF